MKKSQSSSGLTSAAKTFAPPLVRAVLTEDYRRHLRSFIEGAWPVLEPGRPFIPSWHIDCICEHLEALSARQIRRLIINLPARHTKSMLVCVGWFCWDWIKRPELRWFYAAHAESLSVRDSVKCRNLLQSDWYQSQWGHLWEFKDDENSKAKFANSKLGYRYSTSVGGGVGEGADVVVGDDLHKILEVRSKAARLNVTDWWDQCVNLRGNDPETVVQAIIMHRLHEDDICGHVLAKDMGFEHLKIPLRHDPERAVFTSLQKAGKAIRDPRKEKGELLWPARFSESWAREQEMVLGPWGAASQLQQSPQSAGGNIIKAESFLYFSEEAVEMDGQYVRVFTLTNKEGLRKRYLVNHCRWFQTCDTAYLTGQDNDYTVIGTFCQTPDNDLLVYNVYRDKLEVPYQYPALMKQRLLYPNLMFQAIEKKQSGIGLVSQGALAGTPFRILSADTDKIQRAAALVTMYENGKVYHRVGDGTLWLAAFEDEITRMPQCKHDDQWDVAAYAGTLCVTDALLNAGFEVTGELMVYPNPAIDLARGRGLPAPEEGAKRELTEVERMIWEWEDDG